MNNMAITDNTGPGRRMDVADALVAMVASGRSLLSRLMVFNAQFY